MICARHSKDHRQTAWSGRAQKSHGGLQPGLESASIANAAGSICGGWVGVLLGGVVIAELRHVPKVTALTRARDGIEEIGALLWHLLWHERLPTRSRTEV